MEFSDLPVDVDLLLFLLPQATYSVNISENSPAGTFVVDVNATDRDTGDFGEVRYQLEDNPNNAFSIDPITVTRWLL